MRKKALRQVSEIVKTNGAAPREIMAATRVLLSATRINLDVVKTTMKAQDHEEFGRQLDEMEHRNKMEDQRRAAVGRPYA